MKLLLILISLVLPTAAQDISSVLNAIYLIRNPPLNALTVTASQGDGTVLNFGKVAGSQIYLTLSATSSSGGTVKAATIQAGGLNIASTPVLWGFGDALCLLLTNPTSTIITVSNSWIPIPPTSVAYQCSTNIRTNGTITGQTAVV